MKLLGVTWDKSVLVSFDPYTGAIVEKHAWLNPNESFRGLAYNSKKNVLFALSQIDCNLYSIDPLTRNVALIGRLNINGNDIGGLTYDPANDILYTAVNHFDADYTNISSDLVKVDMDTAVVTVIGKIADGLCGSLSWRDYDGKINAFVKYGSGSSDSSHKANVVSISPNTAAMTTVFETPYHTIMGLAKKPGENSYFSWVNWTSHFYGEVNLDTKNIATLASSDGVGVSSDAMIIRSFYIAPAPNLPPCSFSNVDCMG